MVCEQYLSNTVKSEKKGGRLVQDLLWQVCVTKLRVVLSKCPLPSPASDLGCGTSNRAQNCVSENHSQVVCPVLWIWQWLELFLGPSGADLRASSQQWGERGGNDAEASLCKPTRCQPSCTEEARAPLG